MIVFKLMHHFGENSRRLLHRISVRYMMKHFLILILSLGFLSAQAEEYIVVSGYGLENSLMDTPKVCPEGSVCMRSWFKYKINVLRTIKGSGLSGEITAVRNQHATYIMEPDELAVFVLRKIESKEEREKFRANYMVHEFSRPETVYCFNEKPEKYDVKPEDEIKYHPVGMWERTCINQSELLAK